MFEEMPDRMFVAALYAAENPMTEDLLRALCLEAAARLNRLLDQRKRLADAMVAVDDR